MEHVKYDVKALRRRLGLSQRELAERIDATERTVGRWEKGETTPQGYHLRAMKRLEEMKFRGIVAERPATPAPKARDRKKLPPQTIGSETTLGAIGINPSSY